MNRSTQNSKQIVEKGKVQLSALLGNYNRHTNQPTDRHEGSKGSYTFNDPSDKLQINVRVFSHA